MLNVSMKIRVHHLRKEKKRILVLLSFIFVFLSSNVNNILMGNVNAVIISSSSPSPLFTGQGVVSSQGNLIANQGNFGSAGLITNPNLPVVNLPNTANGLITNPNLRVVNLPPNTATGNNCPLSSSTLTVTKQVIDQGLTNGLSNTIQFTIIVNINGVPNPLLLSNGQSGFVCIPLGASFSVTEDTSQPVGFQFSFALSGTCSSAANLGQLQSGTCIVTNTITSGSSTTNTLLPFGQSNAGNAGLQNEVQNTQVSTPQNPAGFAAGFGASAVPVAVGNPPFKPCQSNELTSEINGHDVPGIPKATVTDLTQIPSSATYIVEGNVDLNKVRSFMNSVGTDRFNIQLLSDLQRDPADQQFNKIELAAAAPQFTGNVIVQSNDGSKQIVVPFKVTDMRTECKFITLAEAVGPFPNSNIAPLGEIGKPDKNAGAPDINKLLIGGPIVTRGDEIIGLPAILNPPFPTCQGMIDDIAIYNIMGISDDRKNINGDNLMMAINVDLVQLKTDLAKFSAADEHNNRFVNVNLMVDKNKNTGHNIPFALENMWTDCTDIVQTGKSIYKPSIGEPHI